MENALLFSPRADELALLIQKIAASPALRMKLIASGLETVTNLSFKKIINRFNALYKSILFR